MRAIDDLDTLQEWRAQAAALEAYLRSKDLQRPMLGAQRRVEARIGELLGETSPGGRTDLTVGHDLRSIERDTRADFRLLARGFTNLTDEEWRKAGRVSMLERMPAAAAELRLSTRGPPAVGVFHERGTVRLIRGEKGGPPRRREAGRGLSLPN